MSKETFDREGPEALFSQSSQLIEAGDSAGAAALLSGLIAKYPGYGRAHNHLGFLWETVFRDLSKAEDHYKTCLELCPDYPAIYFNYSVLLSTQSRYEELETLLTKALKVPGINEAKIQNEFGILYEKQCKYELAILAYRKAIRSSFSKREMQTIRFSISRVCEKRSYFHQLQPIEAKA